MAHPRSRDTLSLVVPFDNGILYPGQHLAFITVFEDIPAIHTRHGSLPHVRDGQISIRLSRLEIQMAEPGSELGRMVEPLDPLALFEDRMLPLLQHIGRWRRFHIIATGHLFNPPRSDAGC